MNGRDEVEDADDGDEVEVDPGSVPSEPDVLVEDGGHVLQGSVFAQSVQALLDPVTLWENYSRDQLEHYLDGRSW